jgi:hypothetical protein
MSTWKKSLAWWFVLGTIVATATAIAIVSYMLTR